MSDEGLPASPPSPESDAAPAGCCGWFSSSSRRRRAAARKYVAPGDGPSKQAGLELSAAVAAEPAEAQPTTLGQTRETNKSVSSANGASSSSPAPTRVAFAEPAPAAHPGSSDSPPPARDESTDPSPAVAFLAQWECAVKLLREYCNAATESSPASSTLIASWIEEEGRSSRSGSHETRSSHARQHTHHSACVHTLASTLGFSQVSHLSFASSPLMLPRSRWMRPTAILHLQPFLARRSPPILRAGVCSSTPTLVPPSHRRVHRHR